MEGKYSEVDLLELLSHYDQRSTYENIKIIEAITIFLNNDNNIEAERNIYVILIQFISRFITDKNYEIRYKIVDCLFKCINKINKKIVYSYIYKMSKDSDYRVKIAILNNIRREKEKEIYLNIIEKYSADNNFLVRNRARDIK